MFFQSCSHDIQHCTYFGIQNDKLFFLNVFLICNWGTGSPPQFETLLASFYPAYIQSVIISHSACAEQYGDMSSQTQTHALTQTQLNHQLVVSDKSAILMRAIAASMEEMSIYQNSNMTMIPRPSQFCPSLVLRRPISIQNRSYNVHVHTVNNVNIGLCTTN